MEQRRVKILNIIQIKIAILYLLEWNDAVDIAGFHFLGGILIFTRAIKQTVNTRGQVVGYG